MKREDRLLWLTGSAAALGVSAGAAEIFAGTVGWAGDKNDPTTLGWVTIGLGVVVAGSGLVAARARRPEAHLSAAVALFVCAVVGLTTAGAAWIPAAVAALLSGVLVVRRPRGPGVWRNATRGRWAPALMSVLALVYLTFGIVARDRVGLLGVAGAVLTFAALAARHRSRAVAAIGLILAAAPFASATAWSVVTPATAALMLAIGLPYILGGSDTLRRHGETS